MALEGFPIPLSPTVKLVRVTGDELGLLTITWATGVLTMPGSWVESEGALGPAETVTETAVGVRVAVDVGVKVGVFVLTAVLVEVFVVVLVDVFVAVKVRVGVAVEV